MERTGDWAGAEKAARAIEGEGKTREDDHRRALGLFTRATLDAATGDREPARQEAREAARLVGKLGEDRTSPRVEGQRAR